MTDSLVDVRALHHQLVQINRALRTAGAGSGLSAGSAAALWTISCHAPLRLSRLADIESVSTASMSRIVSSLEDRGYVQRLPDPDDARARLLVPTDAGRQVMSTTQSARVHRLTAVLESLDPDQRASVERAFAILSEALGPSET